MSFLFVNLFDTAGTLLGVATRAKLTDELGNARDFDKALKADSSSSIFGTFLVVRLSLVMLKVLQGLRQEAELV